MGNTCTIENAFRLFSLLDRSFASAELLLYFLTRGYNRLVGPGSDWVVVRLCWQPLSYWMSVKVEPRPLDYTYARAYV